MHKTTTNSHVFIASFFNNSDFNQMLIDDPRFRIFLDEFKDDLRQFTINAYSLSSGTMTINSPEQNDTPSITIEVDKDIQLKSSHAKVDVKSNIDVRDEVMKIMMDETGYPEEMLLADLDLESDLGVDTVKQMEIAAALGEKFKLDFDANFNVESISTIDKMVALIHTNVKPNTQDRFKN